MTRFVTLFIMACLVGFSFQSIASTWDIKIRDWKEESALLEEKQIPKLEQAAAEGDLYAIYLLFIELPKPRYHYIDRPSAKKLASYSEALAKAGNSLAMRMIGSMYRVGKGGVPKNEVKAVEWYQKAIMLGDGGSMANLGYMYEMGMGGLARDEFKAVELYKKGADQGDGGAMFFLSEMYANGIGGLTKDKAKAAEWRKNAKNAGYKELVAK